MPHSNTVFSELLKFVPRHEFEQLAKVHHSGRSFRTASRWDQFIAMLYGQLSGRNSLRDIVDNTHAQSHRLYHLGGKRLSRTTLARINEDKPCELYQALFEKLLGRCLKQPRCHDFRFSNALYSMDSTTIDLCLSIFPWAKFRSTKGAVKLHVGLNHAGYLPEFVSLTNGNTHDLTAGKQFRFPAGSIIAADRAYIDYKWYNSLNNNGVYFVCRQKTNADYRVLKRTPCGHLDGVTSDQMIEFRGFYAGKNYTGPMRRVGYQDPDSGKHYVYITNNTELSARTIADIYKSRWQIELFFKCIKQNLKIKSFVGTSKNAVMTQIWIALCAYLIVMYLKFVHGLTRSIQQIIRLLHTNLFDKRPLIPLLRGEPVVDRYKPDKRQTSFLKS